MALIRHMGCVMVSSTWLCELRIQSHHFKEVLQNLLRRPRHYVVSAGKQNKTHPSLIKKHWLLMLDDTAMALDCSFNVCLWLLHLITILFTISVLGQLKMKGSLGLSATRKAEGRKKNEGASSTWRRINTIQPRLFSLLDNSMARGSYTSNAMSSPLMGENTVLTLLRLRSGVD